MNSVDYKGQDGSFNNKDKEKGEGNIIDIFENNIDLSHLLQEHNVRIFKKSSDTYDIINSILESNVTDEAFYIVDIGRIIRQYLKWKELLPDIEPHYAIKANANPLIIKTLASMGCKFDCASKNEIATVISITNDPSRIIYANPIKMIEQIRYSRANDVDLMTFDNETELHKIRLYHPYAHLVLRIKVNDSKSLCKFSSKFGADLEEAAQLLNVAKSLQLTVIGVSFHVGSGCMDASQYADAIRDARAVFNIAKDQFDITMTLLDIGGGFSDQTGLDDKDNTDESTEQKVNCPNETGDNDNVVNMDRPLNNKHKYPSFDLIAETIKQSLNTYFDDLHDVRVIAEPGRFFVANSHTLVLSVIGKKSKTVDGLKQFSYYLSEGIYGSFNNVVFDHFDALLIPFNERDGKVYPSVIWGPTCDSIDRIIKQIMLPELCVGEYLYTERMGAYTQSSATSFNGFNVARNIVIMTC